MGSKEVLLINPSSPMLESQRAVPPLGVLYLAAVLEKAGHQVKVIDAGEEGVPSQELFSAEFVGVSSTTPQYSEVLAILRAIKMRNKHFPRVVLGGPHATYFKETLLKDGWDAVCIGEGEQVISNMVEGKFDGRLIIGERVESLDSLPFPSRHLLDPKSYHRPTEIEPTAPLISSRGCPFNCVFCSKEVSGRTVRYRSPENFVSEVKEIQEKHRINRAVFYDDVFTLFKERVLKICKLLRPLHVNWRCNSRVDTISPEILHSMREAGCYEIAYGIESADNNVLVYLQKGTDIEINKKAIIMTKEAGIKTKVYLMFGAFLDSRETAKKLIAFIEETNPDSAQLSILTPLPGSTLYRYPEKFGITLNEDIKDSSYYYCGLGGRAGNVTRSTKFLSPEEFSQTLDVLYNWLNRWHKEKINSN